MLKEWKKHNPKRMSDETKFRWWLLWFIVLVLGTITILCFYEPLSEFRQIGLIIAFLFFITGLLLPSLFDKWWK
jgi:quinol-cytochrome oxidoreductase complex cytochrome b subunit